MQKFLLIILAGTVAVTARNLSLGDFCNDITEIADCVSECMLIGGVVQPVKSQRDARFLCLPVTAATVNNTECCSTLRGMVLIKDNSPCFPSEYCHETPLSEGSECESDLQCESFTCLSSQCTAPSNPSQQIKKQMIQSRERDVSSTTPEVRILSNTSYYTYTPSSYSYYYYTSPSTYSSNYYYYYASSYTYTPSYYNYTSGTTTTNATGGIVGGVIGAAFFLIFIFVIVIVIRRIMARKALENAVTTVNNSAANHSYNDVSTQQMHLTK